MTVWAKVMAFPRSYRRDGQGKGGPFAPPQDTEQAGAEQPETSRALEPASRPRWVDNVRDAGCWPEETPGVIDVKFGFTTER